MKLNIADVKLITDALCAWIKQPMATELIGMIARPALRATRMEEFQTEMETKRADARAKCDERQREAGPLLERLTNQPGGPWQFSRHECLLMELALAVWTEEPTHQETSTALMRAMLFGSRSEFDAKALSRKNELAEQERRLRAIPTAYKVVMALNAASEHDLAEGAPV